MRVPPVGRGPDVAERRGLSRQGRLRALMKANRLLAGDLAAPVLLQRIVEAAGELVGAHYAVLGVIAPDGTSFNFVHTGAEGRVGLDLAEGDDPAGVPVDDARLFRPCLEAGHTATGPCGLPEGHPPVDMLFSVPIEIGGERLGNLYISRTARQRFSAEEEELAAALAAIAGVAIKNSRLHRTALTRAEWMRAAAMVTHGALSATEHPLRLVIEQLAQVADADLVAVLLPTADGLELVVDLAAGTNAQEITGARVPVEGSLCGVAYRDGEPSRVRTRREMTGIESILSTQLEIGPVMALPLRGSSCVRGVLAVTRAQGGVGFDEEDLEMAAAFATQAAVSIELAEARAEERGVAARAADADGGPAAAGWAAQRAILRRVVAELGPGATAERLAGVIGHLDEAIGRPRAGSARVPAPRRAQTAPPVGERGVAEVFDELPVMIGYWDAGLCNRMANKAYAAWFGLTPESLHGLHLREVLGADLFERTGPFIGGALRGEAQLFARTLVDRHGTRLVAEASFLPDRGDGGTGEVRGFLEVVTDPAARSNSEGAMADAHARLEVRAAELARANVDLEQFAVMAAHDLRSPLVGIAGLADLLPAVAPELEGDEQAVEMLERISGAAKRGLDLVTDLLDWARPSTAPPVTEPVDLTALARAVALELTAARPDSDVGVGELPVIAGDGAQLRQLFTNLIGNALKYVRAETDPFVTVTAHPAASPDQVLIRVRDNGIGIRAEDRSRVFAMFQRGAGRGAAGFPGSGVGLAICQRVVERHGGRIWIEEFPSSEGTCLAFTLPCVPPA